MGEEDIQDEICPPGEMIIIDLSESESSAPSQTEEPDKMMVDEPSDAQAGSSAAAAAQPKWRIITRTHSSDTTPRAAEAPRDPVTAQTGDTPRGSDREDGETSPPGAPVPMDVDQDPAQGNTLVHVETQDFVSRVP